MCSTKSVSEYCLCIEHKRQKQSHNIFFKCIWPAFDETDGPGPCQAAAIPKARDPGHPATLEL